MLERSKGSLATSSMDFFNTETIITSALAVAIIYGLYRLSRRKNNLPPGPIGLPFVGYLPFLTRKPYMKFQELSKTYGPVFSVQIASFYAIVLCDFQSIKKALNSDAFTGRPPGSLFDLNKETIEKKILSGKNWNKQRRLSLQILKDLGFGKSKMQEHIKEEICHVLERLEDTEGEPTVIRSILISSMANNISSLVFGRRMHHNDERRIMLDKIFTDINKLVGQIGILTFFPWLAKIVRFLGVSNIGKLAEVFGLLKGFITREINEHEQSLDPGHIRDYIDGYLLQIEKGKSDPDTGFLKPVLEDLVSLFYRAGSETVRVTMDWITLTLASFPDVQDKVHQEIDDVIGRERFPVWSDHTKMPYTEAVMYEVLRWKSIVPINPLGYTLEDTELDSYRIPKNSLVVVDLWAVQHDPALWKEPNSFKPERFLSKDGKTVQKPEYFIPFSIGKRSCPGESFALSEIFLYFTAIFQRFDAFLPEGAIPDFEPQLGITLQQKPQELQLKRRHQ